MKAIVDCDLCIGCGLCEESCPEVFRVVDEGCAQVLVDSPGHEQYECIQEAVEVCPTVAISVTGE